MHFAASKSNLDVIKFLISAEGDINAKTVSGETPLVKAVKFNQILNVKCLLRYGADIDICFNVDFFIKNGFFNETVQDIAQRLENENILNLLQIYKQIKIKICLVLHAYGSDQDKNKLMKSFLCRFSFETIQNLVGYIIP